ncbi:hypothetical protein LTR85_012282 [Meristemomyces frigidus]|nr:hypothetical protein LTR85_012282 [Meristemomyces frigidus]
MPSGLSGAYERNWRAISSQSLEERERAGSILAWALYAFRPLTVSELSGALTIELGQNPAKAGKYWTPDATDEESSDDECIEIDDKYVDGEILDICGSLVETRAAIASDSPALCTIHLVHFSVKECLYSLVSSMPSSENLFTLLGSEDLSHLYLAKVCIRYLNRGTTWKKQGSHNVASLPGAFFNYAAESWYLHVHTVKDKDLELQDLVTQFLDSSSQGFHSWRRHFESSIDNSESQEDRSSVEPSSGLYYAALFDLTWAIKILQEQSPVDLNLVGGRYGNALQATCAKGGNLEAFDTLMDWIPQVNRLAGEFGSAVNAAAAGGYESIVTRLIIAGADVEMKDSMGRMALYTACENGHLPIVEMLLDKGADLSTANIYGWTPINCAARNGHHKVVKLLLEKGADLSIANTDGWTAVQSAANIGHLEVAKLLLENGANLSTASTDGSAPLNSAARNGHLELFKLLLEKGADLSTANTDGWTPVNWAANSGHLELVKLLLEKGADPSTANTDGRTPVLSAADNGHLEIVELLVEKGADLSTATTDGWTPVHSTASRGHVEVVKLLIECG